jgi:hypothetical protein
LACVRDAKHNWSTFNWQAARRGIAQSLNYDQYVVLIRMPWAYCREHRPHRQHQAAVLPQTACLPCCAACNFMNGSIDHHVFLRHVRAIASWRTDAKFEYNYCETMYVTQASAWYLRLSQTVVVRPSSGTHPPPSTATFHRARTNWSGHAEGIAIIPYRDTCSTMVHVYHGTYTHVRRQITSRNGTYVHVSIHVPPQRHHTCY